MNKIKNIFKIFVSLVVVFFFVSCKDREFDFAGNMKDIVFRIGTTRATVVTTATINANGFYVSAASGTPGSEVEAWTNTQYTYNSGSGYFLPATERTWPDSNPNYKFFASNSMMAFSASGATVSANASSDVICAYISSPTYMGSNTFVFDHVFARIGDVTITAGDGYTISDISVMVTPRISGTYNIEAGYGHTDDTGWSGLSNGSAVSIANATPGTKSNDLWLVPGTYNLLVSYVASKSGEATQTYTDLRRQITIESGKSWSISFTLSGQNIDTYTGAVDLGYRDEYGSPVLFSRTNLGADNPWDYGDYYAWAETSIHYTGIFDNTISGTSFNWNSTPYHSGSDGTIGWTKYIPTSKTSYWSGSGSPDNLTSLKMDDDVVRQELGDYWRTPTEDELLFLTETCTHESVSDYLGTGVAGIIVTGTNGNTIFIPYAGLLNGLNRYNEGIQCRLWGASLDTDTPSKAYHLVGSSETFTTYSADRLNGFPIRPVFNKTPEFIDLKSITFTRGGYVDTHVLVTPTDRIYFKFKVGNSINSWIFGRSTSVVNGTHNYRLFAYINQYGEFVLNNTKGTSTVTYNTLIGNSYYMKTDTIYELDFNFNSSNFSNYKINNSTAWLDKSRSYLSDKPNNLSDSWTLYLNNSNSSGQPMSNLNNSVQTNSMTIYEFRLTDSSGNDKCYLKPKLLGNIPILYDEVNDRIIHISSVSGYTPTITYDL